MEWIKAIFAKHTKEDGTVDIEAANKEIDQEFPKNAVPKDQYNNTASQLSEANKTLKTLEEKTKDNPDVQKELSDLKEKAESLEKENTDLKINGQVSAALQAVGAKDVEYATFKLGTLEIDKDGNVKDLDSKIKDLQTSLPDYFAKADETNQQSQQQTGGYKPVDNKLPEGQQTETDPFAEIMAKYD
ncbi:phage scaffolding protein [Enterococcus pseudoavium]|uniref:Phage scaffolding protein n=1 Tax=Enterococcus pseudoavium TaxID=44007 RepID=A0AAE4L398_9ENTE|nr:phage scaffolding protein [Enterococcus pseudoavium]MDT2737658.1 phage scaffolding protein [Enterococcus pseudoavium]